MELIKTSFSGLYKIKTKRFTDFRGGFHKLYNKIFLEENNLISDFVDLNHSRSLKKGILRGFHYQKTPYDEVKLVACLGGKIRDYAIDMRSGSSTYLKCFSLELTSEDNSVLYIPSGFAHGYMALEDFSEVIYLSSNYYSSEHERVINPLDPTLEIHYETPPILSEKDKNAAFLQR